MTEVISVKFKNRGKAYFFSPEGMKISAGMKLVVETSKGLELADCCMGNHLVDDGAVPPLRPVVRIATANDLRIEEINRQREKEAFEICRKKIVEHGLDMKLVDVECNFEGSKTMFFFTSDGRVDFRELVKDLAGIFRNRIELRQIGVRDEAKMIGGIGICGRPYCCNRFLEEFQPVSTKMAKVQSLSLNPTKISGSCGRLMCCLRYEEEAYEDLLANVPKQGAFVQTKDGYGTVVQVNLLRQLIKVKLDGDGDDELREYHTNELAAVPGGRPKEGDELPDVLEYVPPVEDAGEVDGPEEKWDYPTAPVILAEPVEEAAPANEAEPPKPERRRGHERRNRPERRKVEPKHTAKKDAVPEDKAETPPAQELSRKPEKSGKPARPAKPEKAEKPEKGEKGEKNVGRHKGNHGKSSVKPVKVEEKQAAPKPAEPEEAKPAEPTAQKPAEPKPFNRRRHYYHKPKPKKEG